MKIEKYIKTKCGLEEYNTLKVKSENSLYYKMRLILFVITASIRDLLK